MSVFQGVLVMSSLIQATKNIGAEQQMTWQEYALRPALEPPPNQGFGGQKQQLLIFQ
jgi:hypothetical protein